MRAHRHRILRAAASSNPAVNRTSRIKLREREAFACSTSNPSLYRTLVQWPWLFINQHGTHRRTESR